jgi:hypothetical protein
MLSLAEKQVFYDRLEKHDWHFERCDDPAIYWPLSRESRALQIKSSVEPELGNLHSNYKRHALDGAPKPERPE